MYVFSGFLFRKNALIHKKIIKNQARHSNYCMLISGVDHEKVNSEMMLKEFA
jgi:hypothetical protein